VVGAALAVFVVLRVPQEFKQAVEPCDKAQLIPLFRESFWITVAKSCNTLRGISAEDGVTDESEIAGTVMVMPPVFVGSDMEVAVTITLRSLLGGVGGAV
jgi:hypothetical protein